MPIMGAHSGHLLALQMFWACVCALAGDIGDSGHLLAPQMFWACVLLLLISDMLDFLHLLIGDPIICDLVRFAVSIRKF